MIPLFILFGLLFSFIALWIITERHKKPEDNKAASSSFENFTHISIKYTQTRYSGLTIRGGMMINADLFFDEEIIVVQTGIGKIKAALIYPELPITFSLTPGQTSLKTRSEVNNSNVIYPDSMKFGELGSLFITYEIKDIVKFKYEIQIEARNKEDKEKLQRIKEMPLFSKQA